MIRKCKETLVSVISAVILETNNSSETVQMNRLDKIKKVWLNIGNYDTFMMILVKVLTVSKRASSKMSEEVYSDVMSSEE